MLVLTLAPSALLAVLGWRLFREDQASQLRTLDERREYAAERVASAMERVLQGIESQLGEPRAVGLSRHLEQVSDAAVVTIREGMTTDVHPVGRLAYLPSVAVNSIDTGNAFLAGEFLEYRNKDSHHAIIWYRNAARRATGDEKAGALLRLARALRRQGSFDEALATYSTLIGSAGSIEGVPTTLLARWMRCDLLEALHRQSELTREATRLLNELRRGGWVMGRAAYEVHLADAARWSGLRTPPSALASESLARAADEFLPQHREFARDRSGHVHRQLVATGDGFGVAIVRAEVSQTVAFVALPSYVKREWLSAEQRWLEREHLRVTLQDPGRRNTDSSAAQLRSADTGLPWTIAVAPTDVAAELAYLAERRNLWLAALAALGLLVLAGTAVAARAVSSELAVARLQSDFVSAVSHEFRTPLTSLRQIGEALQDARVNTEERHHYYYGALIRQTDRLQRLVEGLLDFGRMEAGAATYNRQPVEIDQLVETVAAEFREESAARDEEVQVHVRSEAVTALADREALSNAVRNLLDNAIKYSPGSPEAWVEVRVDDRDAAISVRDRGMGIPLREQRRIFRKFTRGGRAISERIKGTGIGLAVVRHVVEGHGGRITVLSQPDAGSTFTIWLPSIAAADGARRMVHDDQAAQPRPSMGRVS